MRLAPGIFLRASRSYLKDDLHRELRVERFARTDGGIAEIRSKSRTDCATLSSKRKSHRSQVGAVENVEQIGAELSVDSLDDGSVFVHGEIDRGVAWVIVLPAPRGRILARRRINKSVRVEPLHHAVRSEEHTSELQSLRH